jgi:hypothetical protein
MESVRTKNQFVKEETKITMRTGDDKILPARAFIKVVQHKYLPKDWDMIYDSDTQVVVYCQFGMGAINRSSVEGLDWQF